MNGLPTLSAAVALCIANGAVAQVRPQPGMGDARIQTVQYRRDQVVQIAGVPGFQVTIQLAPDEQIQTVAVGDSAAWQVTANKSGNLLFVKATQGGVDTNMTVVTNARFYAFDLVGGGGGTTPYEVRFQYPAVEVTEEDQASALPIKAVAGEYHLSGAKALRPARMSDDGARTFIDWPPDQPLPAVFILDRGGRETLANGNMRGSFYVIDSVHDHLLFRIDRQTARADRWAVEPKAK